MRLGVDERKLGPVAQERPEDDFRLDQRQRGADADMRAMPKRKMRPFTPRDVQPVGVAEARWVAIGRADQRNDQISAPQLSPMQHHVRGNPTSRVLDRALIAQQLAQGIGLQLWRLPQPLPLLGMAQQCMQPVAEQIARRFMTGEQQHGALRQEFRPGLDLAFGLGM